MCRFLAQVCTTTYCERFAGFSYRPCQKMVLSFFAPLLPKNSAGLVEQQTSWCDKIFDNKDNVTDDNLCRRCKIHLELMHALRMLGCTDSKYFVAARNLEMSDEHFTIPRASEDEKINEIIHDIFQNATKGHKDIERLGEMAFGFPDKSTIATTKIRCEGRCRQEQRGRHKFVFGDGVVRGVLEQYREGRRGVKTKAGERIVVDCMWYKRKSETVCEGCQSAGKVKVKVES
jgi:hypothetical protein